GHRPVSLPADQKEPLDVGQRAGEGGGRGAVARAGNEGAGRGIRAGGTGSAQFAAGAQVVRRLQGRLPAAGRGAHAVWTAAGTRGSLLSAPHRSYRSQESRK